MDARRIALTVSILVHTSVLALVGVGPIEIFEQAPLEAPERPKRIDYVPVELLRISEETNVRAAKTEKADDDREPVPDEAAPSQSEPEERKPPRVAARPSLKPKRAEKPEKPPEPKPEPTEIAEAAPVEEEAAARESRREREGEETRTERASEEKLLDLDRIAARVGINEEESVGASSTDSEAEESADIDDRARRSAGLATDVTISIVNAIQRRVQSCWTPLAGAPQPEKYAVEVRFELAPDGRIVDGPHVIGAAKVLARQDRYWNAAVIRAKRAVHKCAPFSELPRESYETSWRYVTLNFDPSDLLAPAPRR